MTHYTGSVPTTKRAADWRDDAICTDDPEAMFPGTSNADIEEAKRICRRCPVIDQCGQWALDTRQAYGVWGGLSSGDRDNILRRKTRRNLDAAAIAEAVKKARAPRGTTLRAIVEASTTPLLGGHLAWTGPTQVNLNGEIYSPKQAVFVLDRGYRPTGPVRSNCKISQCVLAQHLLDVQERAQWLAAVKDQVA